MVGMGYDSGTDIFDYIDKAEQSIFSVSNSILKKDFQSIQNVGVEVFSRIDQLRNTPQSFTGVPSGFTDLDRITNGWQPTDLIILAARPSVGKTALALNLARNAATDPQKRTPIGFFSLEMSANQLVQRIISAESEVPLEAIKTGRVSNDQYTTLLTKGLHRLDSMNLYIDDSAALNIFEFRAKARRMVSKYKVGMIIIDYLQLMSGMRDRNGSREQEISNISRNLKAIAKDLNIPIIALSQLSRAVESRSSSKVPQLSDLRESGAIEQDADMVMFIYRPEYHGIQNNDMGESTDGLTEIKIAKHRNGALGTVQLRAELAIQKFTSIEPSFNQGSWKPVTKQTSFDDGFNEPI
jgi:replicative DNA helicase